MVFDQGNKMVDMNCKREAAGRAGGREQSRGGEAAWSCPRGDASGQEKAPDRSLVIRFQEKGISLPSLACRL